MRRNILEATSLKNLGLGQFHGLLTGPALFMLVLCWIQPVWVHGEELVGVAPSTGGVVATYEDLVVTEDEFYIRANSLIRTRTLHDPDQFQAEAWLRHLVELELIPKWIRREATARGVEDDERFQWYIGYIKDYGVARSVKERVMASLPPEDMIDKSRVEEPEMREHFEKFVFNVRGMEKLRIHYIFFPKAGDDGDKNQAQREKAEKAVSRVRAGEDFVDVMMDVTESEDGITTEPFQLSRRYPPHKSMRDVVERMKPGDITGVLDATAGFYIIYYLPYQVLTELSSFEAAYAVPHTRQRIVNFVLAKRQRTYPYGEYLDSIAQSHDLQLFDASQLAQGEHPPPETVLIRLNDVAYTMDDLYNLADYTVMSSRNIGVGFWVEQTREHMLLARAVYDGKVEYDDVDDLGWRKKENESYEHWLKVNLRNSIMDEDPELDVNSKEDRSEIMEIAEGSLHQLEHSVRAGYTLLITPDQVDMTRLDTETLNLPFDHAAPSGGGMNVKVGGQ